MMLLITVASITTGRVVRLGVAFVAVVALIAVLTTIVIIIIIVVVVVRMAITAVAASVLVEHFVQLLFTLGQLKLRLVVLLHGDMPRSVAFPLLPRATSIVRHSCDCPFAVTALTQAVGQRLHCDCERKVEFAAAG
jgi:hypothetical protein